MDGWPTGQGLLHSGRAAGGSERERSRANFSAVVRGNACVGREGVSGWLPSAQRWNAPGLLRVPCARTRAMFPRGRRGTGAPERRALEEGRDRPSRPAQPRRTPQKRQEPAAARW